MRLKKVLFDQKHSLEITKKSFLNLNRIIRKVVAIGLLYLFTSLIRKPDLDSLFFQILNRLLIMKMRLKGYKTRI